MSDKAVGYRSMGRGATYKERLRRRITLKYCRVELIAGSMMVHRIQMHRTEPDIDWNLPHVFNVIFLKGTYQCQCPFPGFPRSSHTWNGLWNHLNWKR